MKNIILAMAVVLSFLSCRDSRAGTVKVQWTHDYHATDGSIVVLTAFKLYWGINGSPNINAMTFGPPAPLPWKSLNGMYYYSRTLNNAAWVPGSTVCLEMTALADTMESAHTGQVCKVMPNTPTVPVIIDLTTP